MCTATGVGAPIGGALGTMGTGIGVFLTLTDQEKTAQNKVANVAASLIIGKGAGKASDAVPDTARKAIIESIGYGADKSVENEIDKSMKKMRMINEKYYF